MSYQGKGAVVTMEGLLATFVGEAAQGVSSMGEKPRSTASETENSSTCGYCSTRG